MIELVQVVGVEPINGANLRVCFSNGAIGIRDLSEILAEGRPMVEPLRDPGSAPGRGVGANLVRMVAR